MKNFLNKIGRYKFLFIGLFIGLTSARVVNMVMNPSTPSKDGLSIWVFILPPIIAFILYRLLKKNKI